MNTQYEKRRRCPNMVDLQDCPAKLPKSQPVKQALERYWKLIKDQEDDRIDGVHQYARTKILIVKRKEQMARSRGMKR